VTVPPLQWHEHVTAWSGSVRDTGALSPVRDERVQLGLRRLLRHVVLQAANEIEIVAASVLTIAGIQPERQPDLGSRVHQIGSRRENADHLAQPAVDLDGLPDH
jgi:hypothetical protein